MSLARPSIKPSTTRNDRNDAQTLAIHGRRIQIASVDVRKGRTPVHTAPVLRLYSSAVMPVTRRLVIWLLAAVTPLQGMAAAVIVTIGPAHFHAAPIHALILEDFRRGPSLHSIRTRPVTHVATA